MSLTMALTMSLTGSLTMGVNDATMVEAYGGSDGDAGPGDSEEVCDGAADGRQAGEGGEPMWGWAEWGQPNQSVPNQSVPSACVR